MNCFDLLDNTVSADIWLTGVEGEGLHLEWYFNGQLLDKSYYKDNILNGNHKRWYSNGHLYINEEF